MPAHPARRDVLLLTATIAPRPGATDLKHVDPLKRLREYREALDFYLVEIDRGTFSRIVFADNSGYPLDELRRVVDVAGCADRVDLISFDGNSNPDLGRLVLELGLIDEALRRPPLNGLRDDDMIWKVTGRYVIRNVAEIVAARPRDVDVYVNCRNRPVPWTDFYIAAFTKPAFRTLFAEPELYYRPATAGEIVLRERLEDPAATRSLRIAPRMRRIPRISGVRGYDGRAYDDWQGKAKYVVRSALDRVLPKLWI